MLFSKKCRFCGDFNDLLIHSRHTYKNGTEAVYYQCRKCCRVRAQKYYKKDPISDYCSQCGSGITIASKTGKCLSCSHIILGAYLDANGYKKLKNRGSARGYTFEHRLVMKDFLGRPLSKKEVVHHWDEDKNNNEISNLCLFRHNRAHLRIHGFSRRHGFSVEKLKFEQEWLKK